MSVERCNLTVLKPLELLVISMVSWYNSNMKKDVKTTENLHEIIAKQDARITELETLVKFYEEQFRLFQHRKFGSSSEKSEYDQIDLFNEAEATADESVPEPVLTEVEAHYRKRSRLMTDKLPDDLPVVTIEYDLSADDRDCPECGGDMHVMGTETRYGLRIIPAKVEKVEHVRKVYACRKCEKDSDGVPILKAALNDPVIKGSFAEPEAIAHIMTQKFVMGAPLYRQEQDLNRNGIMLSRQTMSNWLLKATEQWLEPIYEALMEMLCSRQVLHSDETTLQVLREPGKSAQSKSYIWLYRTGSDATHPIVLFEYQPDRKASRPATFLKDFSGYLHTDGYEVYHKLHDSITVVGCWSHARRKFDEALKSLPPKERNGSNPQIGKQLCDKLFELEKAYADLVPEVRYKNRLKFSKPVVDELYAWASSLNAIPKSGLGKAVYYLLSQRKYLENFLLDGRLELSNNRAERSIKPFVIDRKNFLFANTPRGAKASAIMFSLIETAKENGLNPFKYLTYIFKHAPNMEDLRVDKEAVRCFFPEFVPKAIKASSR